jgi:hypothetical protein
MEEELKEELRRLGAEVRPGSEMRSDVREMIEAYAPGLPRAGDVRVELKRLAREQVYIYEDPYLKLLIPVPPLDIFKAFVAELKKLGPEVKDEREYITILARAFWLLHQRPERRGLFRRRHALREPSDDEAERFFYENLRGAKLITTSARRAFDGLVGYVLGGKTSGNGGARYCGLAELAVDVATRLHVRPEGILNYNARKFFAVVDALCNIVNEREAAAERKRRRR